MRGKKHFNRLTFSTQVPRRPEPHSTNRCNILKRKENTSSVRYNTNIFRKNGFYTRRVTCKEQEI